MPQEEVDRLIEFYRDEPTAMLLAPLQALDDKIALTAWYVPDPASGPSQGVLAECTTLRRGRVRVVPRRVPLPGPRALPAESLVPGT